MEHKISLVIPVYNEEGHLLEFLKLIDGLQLKAKKELIIVDDCSKDRSLEILKSFPFQSEYKLIEQPKNQGKGAALNKGIDAATGTIVGIQDADFEYSPDEIPSLIEPLLIDRADIVFGSRFKKTGLQVHRTFHYLINRTLTILSNLCSGLYLTDMETCYKFFKREIIQNIELESKRFGFEPEITAKVAVLKCRVMEIPVSYFPRNYLEGKKITWKDGVAALRHIIHFNFGVKRGSYIKPDMPHRFLPSSLGGRRLFT